MALLACRPGARRVYAVDPGASIHLARAAARDSGLADRIEFIQDLSTRVELPERADVDRQRPAGRAPPLSAPRGVHRRRARPAAGAGRRADPARGHAVRARRWRRRRTHRRITGPVGRARARGFDLAAARRCRAEHLVQGAHPARSSCWRSRAPGPCWTTAPCASRTCGRRWSGRCARDGTVHGLSAWFDAELAEGIGFTTGPERAGDHLRQRPSSPCGAGGGRRGGPHRRGPAGAADGRRLRVGLEHARSSGAGRRQGGVPAVHPPRAADSPAELRKRAHDFRPALGEQGRMDADGPGEDGRRRVAGGDRARAAAPLSPPSSPAGKRRFPARPG